MRMPIRSALRLLLPALLLAGTAWVAAARTAPVHACTGPGDPACNNMGPSMPGPITNTTTPNIVPQVSPGSQPSSNLPSGCTQVGSGFVACGNGSIGSNVTSGGSSSGNICTSVGQTNCTPASSSNSSQSQPKPQNLPLSQTQPAQQQGQGCTDGSVASPGFPCVSCPGGGTSAFLSGCPQRTDCGTGFVYAPNVCLSCPGGSTAASRDQCPPVPCPGNNGSVADPTTCPPAVPCPPDNAIHYPPGDPCPAPPPPAASAASGPATGNSCTSLALQPYLDRLYGQQNRCVPTPAGLNTGDNTPYSTCVGVNGAGLQLGGASSDDSPYASALLAPLVASDVCKIMASQAPPGADPNQYLACLNGASLALLRTNRNVGDPNPIDLATLQAMCGPATAPSSGGP